MITAQLVRTTAWRIGAAVTFGLVMASGLVSGVKEASAAPRDATLVVAGAISPTCTLDPFSGRNTCTNAPACFYDPLTGRHTCPDGRAGIRLRT